MAHSGLLCRIAPFCLGVCCHGCTVTVPRRQWSYDCWAPIQVLCMQCIYLLETHQEQLHPKLTFNLAEVSLHMSAAVCVLPACLKRFHGCSRQSYGRTAICDVCLAVWI